MDKTYQEAADDVYADSIADLEAIIEDDETTEVELLGLAIAVQYLKDKRGELYG